LPKWLATERFAIEARVDGEGNPTKDQMRLMMQSLLADRFKLAVHFETEEVPVFALTLLKPGKLGPKLRLHADGPPCDARVPGDPPANGALAGGSEVFPSMAALADFLSRFVGRPVVDKAGITDKIESHNRMDTAGTRPSVSRC